MTRATYVEEAVRRRLASTARGLREHLDEALDLDPAAVHATRIACRRARALLPVLTEWVPDTDVDLVAGELAWLRRGLGDRRDAHVIVGRLEAAGGVPDIVAETLEVEDRAAVPVDADRARLLVIALEQLAQRAATDAGSDVRRSLSGPQKLLRARVRRARRSRDDRAWHAARRTAKTVRYLAEAVVDVGGKDARRVAKRARRLADLLGERQDAVVTRDLLQQWSDLPEIALLLGRQEEAVDRIDAEFPKAWRRFEKAWRKL